MKKRINTSPEQYNALMEQFSRQKGDMWALTDLQMAVILERMKKWDDVKVDEFRKQVEKSIYFEIVFQIASDLSIYSEENPSREQNIKRITNVFAAGFINVLSDHEARLFDINENI